MTKTKLGCNQCNAGMVDGSFCHQPGCPNTGKTWVAECGQWIAFQVCSECNSIIALGQSCPCQDTQEIPAYEVSE